MLHLQYILIRRSLLNNVNHNHILYFKDLKKQFLSLSCSRQGSLWILIPTELWTWITICYQMLFNNTIFHFYSEERRTAEVVLRKTRVSWIMFSTFQNIWLCSDKKCCLTWGHLSQETVFKIFTRTGYGMSRVRHVSSSWTIQRVACPSASTRISTPCPGSWNCSRRRWSGSEPPGRPRDWTSPRPRCLRGRRSWPRTSCPWRSWCSGARPGTSLRLVALSEVCRSRSQAGQSDPRCRRWPPSQGHQPLRYATTAASWKEPKGKLSGKSS